MKRNKSMNRRKFLKTSAALAGAGLVVPSIISCTTTRRIGPNERINLGFIGAGRIARSMDIPEFLALDDVQVVAVCDVDSVRMRDAKEQVESFYTKKTGKPFTGCAMYGDFRELVARDDIDAVAVCTPDHWHALPAIAAAEERKDIFIQKPLTLTIHEGRVLSDTVRDNDCVLLVGSQQRSHPVFLQACELVRNNRIGQLHTVKVGLPTDPGCGEEPEMEVPENLDYDMWIGSTPMVPYTEKRVHPRKGYGRPGWLRIQAYGAGMITGWGSHHLDTAHWGMDKEQTGPVDIRGEAEFPESGLWDVHGNFRIEYTYGDGKKLICADNKKLDQGVRFEGSEGWIHVKRWKIQAEPESILTSEIGPEEVHLYKSDHHKQNFIDCIRSREPTVAPVEIGHRSCSVCLLGAIAMNLGRKLKWDPDKERFLNDIEANGMLSRPIRSPWGIEGA